MLLVFVGNTWVLTIGQQIFDDECPNYNPPTETCSGDAPNRNLEKESEGVYNQHKAALALLDCDELPLRVFTDATFECPPDASSNVLGLQESVLRRKRSYKEQRNNKRSGPRPVGVVYATKESVQKLKNWIATHPSRARDILRYINFKSSIDSHDINGKNSYSWNQIFLLHSV